MCSLKFIASLWELLHNTILFLCGSTFKTRLDIYQLLMTYFDVFKDHLPESSKITRLQQCFGAVASSHAGSRCHSCSSIGPARKSIPSLINQHSVPQPQRERGALKRRALCKPACCKLPGFVQLEGNCGDRN